MFLGTHNPRLDEKGRLFLPARYRDKLADGLVVTRGQEHSLFVFPIEEFTRLSEQLRTAPMTNKAARDYLRVFLSGASDEVPDRQGRITIPPVLREYARLTRDCTVIGAGGADRDLGRADLGDLPGQHRGSVRRPGRGGGPRLHVTATDPAAHRSTGLRRGLHPLPPP